MQYKNTKKIMLDQRKLETLFRIGCPDHLIIELLKTGTFTPTGDSLIDDNLESLIDHKIFNNNNWGGKREGAGRPKNNQDKIQDENQDGNQDTDIDIYNNINNRDSNKGGMGGKEKGENNFTPPKDADEVYEYAQVSGMMCSKEQAQDFYDYYSGIGWRIGNEFRTPINDWHPFWRKWLRNPIAAKQAMKSIPRPQILNLTARERQDLINKEKTQALLKQLKEQGN